MARIYSSPLIALLNMIMLFAVMSLLCVAPCFGFDVILQWDKNLETDLAGYKVYYRSGALDLPFNGRDAVQGVSPINVANQTSITLNGLDPYQDHFFAITAYNLNGLESVFSNIVFIPKLLSTNSSTTTPFTYDDALSALKAAIGKLVLNPEEAARLDVAPVVNGISVPNGKIDAGDAIVILSQIQLKAPI